MSASMRPSAPVPAGSLVHRKSLVGFRAASEQMWGQAGMERIARDLPEDVRERTAGLRPLPEWIPLEDLIAWHVAVWDGPARRDETVMKRHMHATVDQGFGRVKRMLLSVATPHTLAPRVVALWRDEYSTGTLTASDPEARSIQLALRDHPYVEHPLMRIVISEVFRYVLGLTSAKNVTAVHVVRDGVLNVVLRWE